MPAKPPRFDWLAGGATTLSLIACYGTLAVIGLDPTRNPYQPAFLTNILLRRTLVRNAG